MTLTPVDAPSDPLRRASRQLSSGRPALLQVRYYRDLVAALGQGRDDDDDLRQQFAVDCMRGALRLLEKRADGDRETELCLIGGGLEVGEVSAEEGVGGATVARKPTDLSHVMAGVGFVLKNLGGYYL